MKEQFGMKEGKPRDQVMLNAVAGIACSVLEESDQKENGKEASGQCQCDPFLFFVFTVIVIPLFGCR